MCFSFFRTCVFNLKVYFSNRSAAYLKLGDAKSKALKDAEKCMELAPEWPKSFSRLGAAQHALRRFDAAVQTLKVRSPSICMVSVRLMPTARPNMWACFSQRKYCYCTGFFDQKGGARAATPGKLVLERWRALPEYVNAAWCNLIRVRDTTGQGIHSNLLPRQPSRLLTLCTPIIYIWYNATPQAGLVLDPKNSALEASLATTKEAQETDRRERWRQAAIERDIEEERLKKQDAFKAKAKAEASQAKTNAGTGAEETKTSGDPLSSFFSELDGAREKAPPQKVERVLNAKYTNQDLGTPKEQMDRLLQHNYKWKNLNAFETLQLGSDATVEDIKQR